MKYRNTLVMLAILLALGSYVYFYEIKGGEKRTAEKATSEKLLSFAKDSVTTLELTASGISLKKEKDNKWTIVRPILAMTDDYAVTSIVNAVDASKRERTFASNPSEYASFGVGPNASAIVLTHEGRRDTLHVGDKNMTGSSAFVRLNSDSVVFVSSAGLNSNANKTLYELRDKSAMVFEVADANRMVLKTPNATFEARKEDGKWSLHQPIVAPADESKITQVLNRVRNGRIKRFAEEEPADLKIYGLDKPAYQMEVRYGSDQATKTLLIGKADKDIFFARDSSRPPVFGLDSSLVRDLNVKLSDMRDGKLTNYQTFESDEITFQYPDRLIRCTKDTSGVWHFAAPDTGKVKSWKVTDLNGSLSGLRVDTFLDKSVSDAVSGIGSPRATISVKTKGKEVASVVIGGMQGNQVYAKGSNQPSVAFIKNTEADKLFVTIKDLAESAQP